MCVCVCVCVRLAMTYAQCDKLVTEFLNSGISFKELLTGILSPVDCECDVEVDWREATEVGLI